MTMIGPVDGPPASRPATPAASRTASTRTGSGFQVPQGGVTDGVTDSQAAEPTATPSPVGHVSLDVLLAAEAFDRNVRRNAAARRQGQAVLRGLGTLQQALLGGGDPGTALADLAQLLSDLPPPPDPQLARILDSIALRARVELARHGG
jgi:hypothetical protein